MTSANRSSRARTGPTAVQLSTNRVSKQERRRLRGQVPRLGGWRQEGVAAASAAAWWRLDLPAHDREASRAEVGDRSMASHDCRQDVVPEAGSGDPCGGVMTVCCGRLLRPSGEWVTP